MENKLEKAKNVFYEIFGESDNPNDICVRRLFGAIGFIACIVALFIPGIQLAAFEPFLYVSAGLLGLTTIDKFRNNNKNGIQ